MILNDPETLILASLADGPKHGYAIMADIKAMAGLRLGPGTLYGAIPRLLEQGLIEPAHSTGRRHPYRLTAKGVAATRKRLEAMQAVTVTGLTRLPG